jgi:hypothetical protein
MFHWTAQGRRATQYRARAIILRYEFPVMQATVVFSNHCQKKREPTMKNSKRFPLTKYASRILYNLFCLAVIAFVLLFLCCDWAEIFYPIG